jgi:hypothetical protein
MARSVASALLMVGVLAVFLTGYYVFTTYNPNGYSFGMGPHMTRPPHVLLLGWASFVLSLVGLWLMWRVWRGSR